MALRDHVLNKHGRCDILVNNVGHWVSHFDDFVSGGPEHWRGLHETNLLHVFAVSHAFLPAMIASRASLISGLGSFSLCPHAVTMEVANNNVALVTPIRLRFI